MKHISAICLVLAFIAFTLTQCKKNNDIHPENPGTDTTGTGGGKISYNKSDTTVSLKNGRITLDIPAGAMKEGIQINTANSAIAFIDTVNLLHQFELKPAGTKFQKPVTLTFHYDSAWLKGNSPLNIGIAYKNEDDGKWYPAVNGDVDTVKRTISIKTTHFSHWSIYTCFHLYMKAGEQLSEDYSQTIQMQPGETGLLLLTMDEPPVWKSDPDKSKEFSDPLIAPLVTPPIDPKESYQKSLAPDEWDVNGIANGDDHVGKILTVSGAQEKLFQYLAPPQAPDNNPVAISATIHTVKYGDIILIQPVEILGKWKLSFTVNNKTTCKGDGWSFKESYSYGVNFHLDKNMNIVYDGNSYQPIAVSSLGTCDACIKITSYRVDDFFVKISGMTGKYDPNTDSLYCQFKFTDNPGTIHISAKDLCGGTGGMGYSLPVSDSHSEAHLTLPLKNNFIMDTTINITAGPETFNSTTTIKLENAHE